MTAQTEDILQVVISHVLVFVATVNFCSNYSQNHSSKHNCCSYDVREEVNCNNKEQNIRHTKCPRNPFLGPAAAFKLTLDVHLKNHTDCHQTVADSAVVLAFMLEIGRFKGENTAGRGRVIEWKNPGI